ncbi:hypothetical protein [Streptomyces antibioticus]|uniref:hypothetical protein n=1 Tax=Streptomyces antibioticus TaxID=1890 RepID=UPI00225B7BF1|nr:hypothetical protein [Streptomyces antibioticus]MCX4742288.1 hypothetical protein [Streptomyces antibioticus]
MEVADERAHASGERGAVHDGEDVGSGGRGLFDVALVELREGELTGRQRPVTAEAGRDPGKGTMGHGLGMGMPSHRREERQDERRTAEGLGGTP